MGQVIIVGMGTDNVRIFVNDEGLGIGEYSVWMLIQLSQTAFKIFWCQNVVMSMPAKKFGIAGINKSIVVPGCAEVLIATQNMYTLVL